MKKSMLLLLVLMSVKSFGAQVYCGDKVDRVQIENGQYLLFMQPETGSVTHHAIGNVGDVLADKYFSMALTAYSMQKPFIVRYTDTASSSCADLRFETAKITYVTVKN